MSLAIANASQIRVFRYNHHNLQWESLTDVEKTCKVQVVKKVASGEYILRIIPEDGEVNLIYFEQDALFS